MQQITHDITRDWQNQKYFKGHHRRLRTSLQAEQWHVPSVTQRRSVYELYLCACHSHHNRTGTK